MKKSMLAILMLALLFTLLSAQKVVNINGTEIDLEGLEELEKLEDMDSGTQNVKIMINKEFNPMTNDGSGYFGIYVDDLNFPKAQKLSYNQMIGVLITGVVQGSPAWEARLQEDDIIMNINDMPVYNKEEFDRLRKNMRPGDALKINLWRSGAEVPVELMLGSREAPSAPGQAGMPAKKRNSVGYGGGGWTPTWLQTDMTDVNALMTSIGLEAYNEDGVLTQGFAGKGHVGKGLFLGFQVNDFNDKRNIRDNLSDGGPYDVTVDYNLSLVGATIDKRFAIAPWLVTSIGVMLGGGSHDIEFTRVNHHYDWPDSLQNVTQGNFNSTLHRGYLMVQPRAELMFRILPWLGLRAEAGYVYTYAPYSGWRAKGAEDGDMVEVQGSPDTKLEGFSIGIGPWFGF